MSQFKNVCVCYSLWNFNMNNVIIVKNLKISILARKLHNKYTIQRKACKQVEQINSWEQKKGKQFSEKKVHSIRDIASTQPRKVS